MENPSFLGRILRLQRKTYDNPFMSIQVQNVQDDDDESSDDDDDSSSSAINYSQRKQVIDVNKDKLKSDVKQKDKTSKLEKDFDIYKNSKSGRSSLKRRYIINDKSLPVAKLSKTSIPIVNTISSDNYDNYVENSKDLSNKTVFVSDSILPISSADDYFTKEDSFLPDKIAYVFCLIEFSIF